MSPKHDTSSDSSVPLIGAMLGSYRIIERIGAGAMGAVYRGFDVHTGAEVALKVLHDRQASQAVFCERLKREAEAVIAIDHPNIVKVHSFGFSLDGLPFMTMELLRGKTLDTILAEEGPLEWKRAARIIREIAVGLAAAHEKGFIHRDLKPGNVMCLESSPRHEGLKILDFGIVAVASDARAKLTSDGLVLGTPTYMAPEQMMSSNVDHRADLYALGIMLFEMLSGQPPFEGCFREVAAKHLLTPPGPLPVSGGMEQVAYKLLAKDKRERFQSAMELVAEIDRLLFEAEPVVVAPVVPQPTRSEIAATVVRSRPSLSRSLRLPPAAPQHRGWLHAGAASLAMAVVVSGLVAFRGPDRTAAAIQVESLAEAQQVIAEAPKTPTPVEYVPKTEPVAPEVVSALPKPSATPVAPAVAPRRAANASTAGKAEPEATYATANERLRVVSARLVELSKRGTVRDLSAFEEEYLDLSAALEPGRDAGHYRRYLGRIEALERSLRNVK